jgi:Ca2+-binding RTX toxin-like protein
MLVGYYGASAALVVIDGPDAEIQDLDYVGVGFNDQDPYSLAGHGTLLVTNGAQITSNQAVVVGAGGTVGGFDGTITSTLYLTGGGLIDLRDGQFGNFDINGDTFVDGAGNQILGDIGANDSNPLTQDGDLIRFNGNFSSTADGQFLVTLNALDGFKFGVGETRIIGELNGGGDANAPTFAVTNQHADFAFYGGTLPGNPGKIVIQALNSGATGGLGIVDFGAGNPAATANYNAVANNGFVSGGRFGVGGSATNVDQFLGTNFNDVLRITTPGNGSRAFTLDGRGGADYLLGGAGADTLIGGAGGDLLNGGAGADLLRGGTDNDVYVVDNANDKVDEATLGSGTGDLVQSSITFSLANNARVFGSIEKLTLTGGLAISGTGNALSNTIVGNVTANILTGNAGNDTLQGGAGNDTLAGGLGIDTLTGGLNNDFFLFNTALARNRDIILDYSAAQDTFRLENAIFTRLGAGVHMLSSAFFRAGPKALDANDYIVYNKATGALFYDDNGSGAGHAIQFATLNNRPTLTFSEFQVV